MRNGKTTEKIPKRMEKIFPRNIRFELDRETFSGLIQNLI